MRDVLARVSGLEPLHLRVGEAVVVSTLDASVTERKVPLPARWLKGFAEVQLAGAAMRPVLEVNVVDARRFLKALPTPSGSRSAPLFATRASQGIRLTSRPGHDAVRIAGPERLRVLLPLLRFARGLRAYGQQSDAGRGASIWELDLDDAWLTVTLSQDVSRGFSGEGGVLWDLADSRAAADADLLSAALAFEPRIDVARLAGQAGLAADRVLRALGHLGAAPARTVAATPTSTASSELDALRTSPPAGRAKPNPSKTPLSSTATSGAGPAPRQLVLHLKNSPQPPPPASLG